MTTTEMNNLIVGDVLRFKTHSEFRYEYGEDWTEKVRHSWNRDMNYLFGREFTIKNSSTIDSIQNDRGFSPNSVGIEGSWSISPDMLVLVFCLSKEFISDIEKLKMKYPKWALLIGTISIRRLRRDDFIDLKEKYGCPYDTIHMFFNILDIDLENDYLKILQRYIHEQV